MELTPANLTTAASNGRLAPYPAQIEAARCGCNESFGLLAEHCRQYLLLIAAGQLGDDLRAKVAPSDLVQETLVLAQRGINQFAGRSEGEFRAWIKQILLHYAAQVSRSYRQTARRDIGREVSLDAFQPWSGPSLQLVADETPPVERAERQDQSLKLRQAMERLTPMYRHVLIHRSVDERSFADIGEILSLSADAARKLWVRAIAALQREMMRDCKR